MLTNNGTHLTLASLLAGFLTFAGFMAAIYILAFFLKVVS